MKMESSRRNFLGAAGIASSGPFFTIAEIDDAMPVLDARVSVVRGGKLLV